MKVAVTRGANDNYNNGIISKAMMRIMIIILTLKVSSNSGNSNNWEGVVLSGWMAEIGEPDSVSWNSKTETNGNMAQAQVSKPFGQCFLSKSFWSDENFFRCSNFFGRCPESSFWA